ncbi:Uncharacterized protein PECH_003324 [Penicillium ucsense]|uniref:Chorismate-utilising enzyme C-terminal domain-containing protein n=1 Tax=Penicillium ucsense TaxID=2839758 RepID=A0A8J8VXI6_9EURO|nr:Uncharacterized protein PECM_000954 [Penicillium ucsense]KAF7729503.1 Uncharacterized protein PECH_003324 [Penicillium ucsense]
MTVDRTSITFTFRGDALEKVAAVLAQFSHEDYFAYERDGEWFIGLGNRSTLLIDSQGKTVTTITGSQESSRSMGQTSISDLAREFVRTNLKAGGKIFGQAGFNFASHSRGKEFKAGQWPLLSLLAPTTELTFRQDEITVAGVDNGRVRQLHDLIQSDQVHFDKSLLGSTAQPNTEENPEEYMSRVEQALLEINEGCYTKVIPSRAVNIQSRINMPATLLLGRRANNPARSFSLNHAGFQATGFSPELVMSAKQGRVITEPLAGTRSRKGSPAEVEKLRQELLNDPKEIVEHVISVREAVEELNRLCVPESITIDDFMSVRPRGAVQHLGSRVAGRLSKDKDMWDAFEVLFPSITASGIPKNAAIQAIQRLEPQTRELYSGAVIMIEDEESLEAALVLRSVFQDTTRRWIQAGAGVIAQSNPERELRETCEKLASVAPFVVVDSER